MFHLVSCAGSVYIGGERIRGPRAGARCGTRNGCPGTAGSPLVLPSDLRTELISEKNAWNTISNAKTWPPEGCAADHQTVQLVCAIAGCGGDRASGGRGEGGRCEECDCGGT